MSPTRRPPMTEVRCEHCGILLAKTNGVDLVIRRSGVDATFTGEVQASIVCYRPHCHALNVVRVVRDRPR
jgi:phage FluMu protein Com